MVNSVNHVLTSIADDYRGKIGRGGRNYLEVNVGRQALRLGYADLGEKYRYATAIVPLKSPAPGMKVRIDGRTFVDYAEYAPGIAVPGYLARASTLSFAPYVAGDSMICNFT